MEFIENPFQANGELSQKADYIIAHSTITRREILIADPDCIPIDPPEDTVVTQPENSENASSRDQQRPTNHDSEDEVVVATVATSTERPPENNVSPSKSPLLPVATPKTVEAEVRKVDTAGPQHAEEVRLKKKRCCSVL